MDVVYAVDLFCGMGGWSCGAKQSGYEIVLAVDSDRDILGIHKLNHPRAAHYSMQLGPATQPDLERIIAERVPEGARWHLHGSPPCQTISNLHALSKTNKFGEGMDMIMWFLQLVFKLNPTTWSFEQVPEREIMGMLRWMRYQHPHTVQFGRFDFADYGLCQHRIRVLAGSPSLLDPMLHDPALRAAHPILTNLITPPDNAAWLRAGCGKTPKPHATVAHADGTFTNSTIRRDVRTVHAIAWTCLAYHPHAFLTADYKHIRYLSPLEMATIQSFPLKYALHPKHCPKNTVMRAIGNALPPLVSRLMTRGHADASMSPSVSAKSL